MILYDGPISTIITAVALALGAICFALYLLLSYNYPRIAFIFFRISIPCTLFGAFNFGACRLLQAVEMGQTAKNIFIGIVWVVMIVSELLPIKESKHK